MKFKAVDPTKCSDCHKDVGVPEYAAYGKPVMVLCAECMKKTAIEYRLKKPIKL